MPSWKVTRSASLVNKTSIFGIMGGLYNRKIAGRSSMNRVTSRLEIPASAAAGYKYMKMHNLLSRNPLGSGGVGRMFTAWPRGSGLGSHSTVKSAGVKPQLYGVAGNDCLPPLARCTVGAVLPLLPCCAAQSAGCESDVPGSPFGHCAEV